MREAVEEHIGAHEYFMIDIGEQNPMYKQQLMQIGQFPLYANFPPPNPNAPPMPMPEQAANPVGRPPQQKGPSAGG